MANRVTRVSLVANIGGFVKDTKTAGKATDDLRHKAERFSAGRYDAKLGVDAKGAEAKLGSVYAQLEDIDHKDVRAQVHVDGTARASKQAGLLVDALATIGPTIGPIAVAATPVFAGLTSGMAAATVGVGSLVLAFHGVGDALKAVNDYQIDPTEAHLQKMHDTLASLAPAGREFVKYLQQLRPQLQGLQNAAQAGLFPGLESGLNDLMSLLPTFERMIGSTSQVLGHLADSAGEALTSPFWHRFFDWLASDAQHALLGMGKAIGNLGKGFAGLTMALDPLAKSFGSALLGMTEDFSRWGSTLSTSAGFHDFVNYVRHVGPEVWETLSSLATAFLDIAQAAAPIGEVTLRIITSLSHVLSTIAKSPVGPVLFGAAAGLAAINRVLRTMEAAKMSNIAMSIRSLGRGALLKRGAAGMGGLALAMSGLSGEASKTSSALGDLVNVASGGLLGFSIGGPIGAAIGAGVGLLGSLAGAFGDASDATDGAAESTTDYTSTLKGSHAAITQQTRDLAANALEQRGLLKVARDLNIPLGVVTDAITNTNG
ncbi:MAG: hypothetical protein ACRDQA_25950, partial [Nocardioidaceae bacterium]